MNIMVCGGAGFIGSQFILMQKEQDPDGLILNLDKLTYAAHPQTVHSLSRAPGARYHFIEADLVDAPLRELLRQYEIEAVINFAAESHVDRSILSAEEFVLSNVLGTQKLLDATRAEGNIRFVQVSTDEVYGDLGKNCRPSEEEDPLLPNSPYAASKASADLLVRSAVRTHQQNALITRCSNNFGPRQFPEKLIPLVITHALEDKPIPVYGDGQQVRDWIYVLDHCLALKSVLEAGKTGEIYHISAESPKTNLEIIEAILDMLAKPRLLIQFVGDRPAHDRRYALSAQKLRENLKWQPTVDFDRGLFLTVQWYMDHPKWWQEVRNDEYNTYLKKNYRPKGWQEVSSP